MMASNVIAVVPYLAMYALTASLKVGSLIRSVMLRSGIAVRLAPTTESTRRRRQAKQRRAFIWQSQYYIGFSIQNIFQIDLLFQIKNGIDLNGKESRSYWRGQIIPQTINNAFKLYFCRVRQLQNANLSSIRVTFGIYALFSESQTYKILPKILIAQKSSPPTIPNPFLHNTSPLRRVCTTENQIYSMPRRTLQRISGMSWQEFKPSKSKSVLSPSDEDFSFEDRSPPVTLGDWPSRLLQLESARDRFLAFAKQLPCRGVGELREDVLSHCQHNSKKERAYESYLNDEMILRLINLRIEKMAKNKRIKKNWSDEDVQILIWIVSKYADSRGLRDVEKDLLHEDWTAVSALIPGVSGESCMFKWLSLKKVNLATNNWSPEQSALLGKLVRETGNKGKKETKDWKLISQRLYFLSERTDKIYRNAKQCREHWNCYLNPNLKKGPWRPEQDTLLLRCIRDNRGSKKWSQIVKHFDGRTENALKNRYTLIIEKQKRQHKHRSELEIIEEYLQKCYVDQFTGELHEESALGEEQGEDSFMSIEIPIKKEEKDRQYSIQKEPVQEQPKVLVEQGVGTMISPVKVQLIDFKNLLQMSRLQLKFIQPGVLMNGIFEKSQKELEQTEMGTPVNQMKLKRYHSSLL